ncbi:MAG: hypothetical protein V2J12_08075 [Gammaproteobacteria bacterium]|jgi:hypothetical protein|nr:hypothetical protein [Gammaproteobacteria bacterium]
MKVPDFLFVIINPLMRLLLRSPLHGLLSDSIVLITYRGRRSGKQYSTPVRYVRMPDCIRCYSNHETKWWRNLRDGAEVRMLTAGSESGYRTEVIENDLPRIREALAHYFSVYPEDAVYHDVKLNRDKQPDPAQLDAAAVHAIVVEARPV